MKKIEKSGSSIPNLIRVKWIDGLQFVASDHIGARGARPKLFNKYMDSR